MGGRRWKTSKESTASPEGKLTPAMLFVKSLGAGEPLARDAQGSDCSCALKICSGCLPRGAG
jgi:hypothetical protein